MTVYIVLAIIAVGMPIAACFALRWDRESDDRIPPTVAPNDREDR